MAIVKTLKYLCVKALGVWYVCVCVCVSVICVCAEIKEAVSAIGTPVHFHIKGQEQWGTVSTSILSGTVSLRGTVKSPQITGN